MRTCIFALVVILAAFCGVGFIEETDSYTLMAVSVAVVAFMAAIALIVNK